MAYEVVRMDHLLQRAELMRQLNEQSLLRLLGEVQLREQLYLLGCCEVASCFQA